MAINEKNGKCAVTHYRVLERFTNYTIWNLSQQEEHTKYAYTWLRSGYLLGDKLYSN